MTFRLAVFLSLICGLGACGFQLRGSNLQALQHSQVYVQSNGANALAKEVKIQLQNADVTPVKSVSDAKYIINLSNESFDRRVLSVSPQTGKVEEYEITYRASLSITGSDGDTILKSEPVTAVTDYTFDEDAVLGKFEEERVLRDDIVRHAASNVLRRLQAVTE
ncbi:MAG: hypothetical protein HY356_02610 [Gammaproteobacteria bacterium]|nr:hypothetical protein [Gammaproteobacteria bacterium]